MSETIRAFIAIELDEKARQELSLLQSKLKEEVNAKWIKPENMHLTLKFLGNITLDQAEQVKNILDEVSKQSNPYHLTLSGIGAFPKLDSPRVLWVGIDKGKDETIEIANKIESSLEGIGFSKEGRTFKAHFTIARIKSPKNKNKLKTLIEQESFISTSKTYVHKLTLLKSTLTPQEALYSVIYKANIT